VQDLLDTLKQCVERLDRYRRPSQRVGESNTKAGLIEPIIAALGWDVLDPDEVHREYRRRPADNPVDYALLLSRTPRLFIEAKGLGENMSDPKWANQTISYAAVAGVEWVALTAPNGACTTPTHQCPSSTSSSGPFASPRTSMPPSNCWRC
jgi:predicted type IV restriction endonuclease